MIDERVVERDALDELLRVYQRGVTKLENTLATLLHEVLFCKNPTESRIAFAIYFSLEGLGQRQAIVNNAITEWFIENPIGSFDYLSLWNKINKRLGTIRATRNLLAHGSVQLLTIRGKEYIRLLPPAYAPKLADKAAKGTIPGKSLDDMEQALGGLRAMLDCLNAMIRVLDYHGEEAQTLQETYDALLVHLIQLDKWFPDALKPQEC